MRGFSLLIRVAVAWFALLLPGCIEPYLPEVISNSVSYLVVDGFINTAGITTIKLSRTYSVNTPSKIPQETKAVVAIEQEGGQRFALTEASDGLYLSQPLALAEDKPYRLLITTAAGTAYASDFVPAKQTPPIDSVTFQAGPAGLTISVNTHDEANATRYYRWEHEETWEIATELIPDIEFVDGKIRDIRVSYPFKCWPSAKSMTITIGKTTGLSEDVVLNQPVHFIPSTTDKLIRKYSILVKQYAQTQEEYNYWELLKKNTESVGSLFDPLPVELTGNIHCTNDESEIALGFIGVHSQAEKRIFITREQIPRTWNYLTGYEKCFVGEMQLRDAPYMFAGKYPLYVPLTTLVLPNGVPIGYRYTTPYCVDCRQRGTDVRPDFWQ